MRNYQLTLILVASVALAAACSSTPPADGPGKMTAAAPDATASTPLEVCLATNDRSLACADPFLDMSIDLRAKHDLPPGVAAKVAADRPAIMALAKKELAVDTVEPKRTADCQTAIKHRPDDKVDKMVAGLQGCLAKEGCGEWVRCMRPLLAQRFADKKAKLQQRVAACVKVKTKVGECIEPFTEMIVDIQAEIDFPKGKAAEIKKDRQSFVAQVKQRLAPRLAPDKAELGCLIEVLKTPPELKKTAAELLKAAEECHQIADCAGFTACMKPIQKRQFDMAQKRAAAAGK